MSKFVLAAITAVAVMLLSVGSAQAAVKDCSAPTRIGSDNPNVGNVSARNMPCSAARQAIENGHLTATGGFRTRGFYCYLIHRFSSQGTVLGATNRCVAGRRAFRFDWAT